MKDITKRLLLVAAAVVLALPAFGAGSGYAQGTSRTFTETGKTVKGRFLAYWNGMARWRSKATLSRRRCKEKAIRMVRLTRCSTSSARCSNCTQRNKAPNDVLLSSWATSFTSRVP